MRKRVIIFYSMTMVLGMALTGCGSTVGLEHRDKTELQTVLPEESNESNPNSDTYVNSPENDTPVNFIDSTESAQNTESTNIVQNGPYGRISIALPEGWNYELCPVDSGRLFAGLYGIRFYPQEVTDGYIEINYSDNFGVCGTGLSQEAGIIAGNPVNIGTYDNNPYWDFISFRGNYDGITVLTYYVDDWWETYANQVLDILDTISFDASVKEGAAYVYSSESELNEIGLDFTLKNISPTGATLVFKQYDTAAPTGELHTGDDFILEVQKDGAWENVPIALEGNYGFHAIAYIIAAGNTSEIELNWEWLYGALETGTYRIKKDINDFRDTGDFDKYTVSAQFILN